MKKKTALSLVLTTSEVQLIIEALAHRNGCVSYEKRCDKLSEILKNALELSLVDTK